MAHPSSVMGNKRFSYLIITAFILGTLLLVFVQINSARNTAKLTQNNTVLLKELRSSNHLREVDRDILGVESRIRASIATNDTSHLEGVDNKINQVLSFLDSLSGDNKDPDVQRLIKRLSVLTLAKKETKEKLLNRYFRLGNMDDTTSIANPRARRISDEITATTTKIYESRQLMMSKLLKNSERMGKKARLYDVVLLTLLLLSGAFICSYIVRQFSRQNKLILQLNESEQKALVAAQTKENFLANMSHEIRTPLSGILGFTNLLRSRKLDPDAEVFVSSIQKSGESLLTIINDILDLSKIEAGMMRIVPGKFSVRGLINSVETFFNARIKEKGLMLFTEVERDIPDTLNGDATRLTQILINLIGNAIKFTENGRITVSVYAKHQTTEVISLGFRITDTGIGIDAEKLEEIFERFNQAEDSVTRNYGGTGLGLAIVKNLVLLQQGNITVTSTPGKGTAFDFYIPYEISDDQMNDQAIADTMPFKGESHKPLNLLVVDDNLMNQSLMKHMLSQWNVSFDIVSSGQEAINCLKAKSYDVVLMDIQMPQMDGYTATQLIRNELKTDIPIIAMTAHAMAGEREKCMSRGMSEYISKPINEQDLFRLISGMLTSELKKTEATGSGPISPSFKVIDLTYMIDVSQGDKEFEQKITGQFITTVTKSLKNITVAYQQQDYKTLNAIAHDLKASVGIMGLLPRLNISLDLLENTTDNNHDAAAALHELIATGEEALKDARLLLQTF